MAFLSPNYADAVERFKDSLGDYNNRYNDCKMATGATVGVGLTFSWIPIFGWAALGPAADNTDDMLEDWGSMLTEFEALNKGNRDEAMLIDPVTKMVFQFKDIDQKIELAVDSVSKLKRMFQSQPSHMMTSGTPSVAWKLVLRAPMLRAGGSSPTTT